MIALTAASIRTAALAYNAEYPEAYDEIKRDGRPVVRVHLENVDSYGRRIRAVVTPGILVEDGWIAADDPEVKVLRRFDGRLTRTEIAKRATRHLGLDSAAVDVEYIEHGV